MQCCKAGAAGYLTKPVHRHQLLKSADHWIESGGRPGRPPVVPQPVAAVADAAVLDTATAVEEFGDVQTVKIVARQLTDNVDGQLRLIRESLSRGDRERVRKEAHAIKGGAATLEAVALSQAAARLEALSPESSLAELDSGLGDLEHQFKRFREFVSQWKG